MKVELLEVESATIGCSLEGFDEYGSVTVMVPRLGVLLAMEVRLVGASVLSNGQNRAYRRARFELS